MANKMDRRDFLKIGATSTLGVAAMSSSLGFAAADPEKIHRARHESMTCRIKDSFRNRPAKALRSPMTNCPES